VPREGSKIACGFNSANDTAPWYRLFVIPEDLKIAAVVGSKNMWRSWR